VLAQTPNLLTLLRLGAVPVLVVLIRDGSFDLAVLVFFVAGISDALDGYIAKRFGYVSRLGAILDPLADKMLIISTFIMLALLDEVPFWLLVTVLFRDILIIGGYLTLISLNETVQMHPSQVSKLNTALLIGLEFAILLKLAGWLHLPALINTLMWAVLITTVLSGIHYVYIWGFQRERVATREQNPE
jgi:cardiolipin synthase